MRFNLNPNSSKIDTIYRSILLSKFFTQGWGDPENMKKIFSLRKIMSNRESCMKMVSTNHPIYIDKVVEDTKEYTLTEGHFISPLEEYLSEGIPEESRIARFQLLVPKTWRHPYLKPICLHLAGTGDHFFWRRRALMAKPLLRESGIGSIILENPFYGSRKPPDQIRSCLRKVSDIFIMGGCLILESIALFNWCEKMNFAPLCVTGISMGGHMASLAGVSWNKPISIIPCLSWTTASCAFTQGVLSGAIPWQTLEDQYVQYGSEFQNEVKKMIHSPEWDEVFNAGRKFAQNFPSSLDSMVNGNGSKGDEQNSDLKLDCLNFMRGIMDECTHLGNFGPPVDPELVTIVTASQDAYVPRDGIIPLTKIWPGAKLHTLEGGHVTAILFNMDVFREMITSSIKLNAQRYYRQEL
ncbi:protein ABHD18-like [Panonychus citri]|uniref:protein ABHD18-like n=1 Tax=Panonychus citri TaxID=50023 RepID=UPI0023077E4A|nr:protein ABHD18-like [Panonychus citri]